MKCKYSTHAARSSLVQGSVHNDVQPGLGSWFIFINVMFIIVYYRVQNPYQTGEKRIVEYNLAPLLALYVVEYAQLLHYS